MSSPKPHSAPLTEMDNGLNNVTYFSVTYFHFTIMVVKSKKMTLKLTTAERLCWLVLRTLCCLIASHTESASCTVTMKHWADHLTTASQVFCQLVVVTIWLCWRNKKKKKRSAWTENVQHNYVNEA